MLPLLAPNARAGQVLQSASVTDTGLQPTSITVDPDRHRLFVTNFGGDAIQSFPISEGCQLGGPRNRETGRGPLSLTLYLPDQTAYVTYFTDDEIGVFSLAGDEYREMGRFPTGRGPVGVAASPKGDLVFVSNVFDGTISVFERTRTGTLEPRETIAAVSNPRSLAIDAGGKFLFVADERDPVIATIAIEDGAPIRPVSKYLMQGPAEDLLASMSDPLLYVTQGGSNRILRLEIGALGQLRQTASTAFPGVEERHDELGGLGRTAPFPGSLALETSGRVFVTGRETSDVHVYSTGGAAMEFESLGSFPAFEYPEDLALDAESGCLYVISSAYGQILGMKVAQ